MLSTKYKILSRASIIKQNFVISKLYEFFFDRFLFDNVSHINESDCHLSIFLFKAVLCVFLFVLVSIVTLIVNWSNDFAREARPRQSCQR